MAWLRAIVVAAVPALGICDNMVCGSGVPLCGVLTLESGLGAGAYRHKNASVHGLWPQVDNYGTSSCIKPTGSWENTSKVYDCYINNDDTEDNIKKFENHEWTTHGQCAGVRDADDFFGQVCNLSMQPVGMLEKSKESGTDFDSMAQLLKKNGYPVWSIDQKNDQIMLSACAGGDGRWVLSTVDDMVHKCGGSKPRPPSPSPSPSPPPPGPSPSPAPSPTEGSCIPGRKGPQCSTDADCNGLKGCVRCAHSGYCTDEPHFRSEMITVV